MTDSGSDDPASESSDMATADPKTYLVMSGGEGYIDFRLGECVAEAGGLIPGGTLVVERSAPPPGSFDSSSSSTGDEGGELEGLSESPADQQPRTAEQSHLIVWQVTTSHD